MQGLGEKASMTGLVYFIRRVCERLTIKTLKQARRFIRIVIGFTLLAVGIMLVFTPGPAMVVIPLSLAILAGEFMWAKRLLEKFNAGLKALVNWNRNRS